MPHKHVNDNYRSCTTNTVATVHNERTGICVLFETYIVKNSEHGSHVGGVARLRPRNVLVLINCPRLLHNFLICELQLTQSEFWCLRFFEITNNKIVARYHGVEVRPIFGTTLFLLLHLRVQHEDELTVLLVDHLPEVSHGFR